MTDSGLFITLYDEAALETYIASGVYGPLMRPLTNDSSRKALSIHFSVFADLACAKPGTHVFFFLKRRIYYGGRISADSPRPAVVLNGSGGRMSAHDDPPQVWVERWRPTYHPDQPQNCIYVVKDGERLERHQPYLIRFTYDDHLSGKSIVSDDFYFELGRKHYPLPANAIDGMSFCTLTPYEVSVLLRLADTGRGRTCGNRQYVAEPPTHYSCSASRRLEDLQFETEAELEATVIACPALLAQEIRPNADATICRQVPISPFKPSHMDRADICIYQQPLVDQGALPNVIIELKNKPATNNDVSQIGRYLRWIDQVAPSASSQIKAFLLAPGYPPRGVDKPDERIRLFDFSGGEYQHWR